MTKKIDNLTFEESLAELEGIVTHLEQGEVSLDNALKQFERGINLMRNSQDKLEKAQQKVSILTQQQEQLSLQPYNVEDE